MNVTMPPVLVKALQDYGHEAGKKLVEGFAPSSAPPPSGVLPAFATATRQPGEQFDHHRWVRLRIVLTHLERELRAMATAAADPAALRLIRTMLTQAQSSGGPADYPYRWDATAPPANALAVFDELIKLVQAHFPAASLVFDQDPPVITPQAVKRLVPIDGYDA